MSKFEVTSLDLTGLTDEDLQNNSKKSGNFLKFLKTPGTYDFTVIEMTRGEDKVDGAGKKWGNLRILASADGEGQTTNVIKTFLDMPIESAVYTSKSGSTSKVKTQIFVRAIESVLGSKVQIADLPTVVATIENILVPGATFRASVKYKNDHITKNAEGEFNITLADGTHMVDENGTALNFADYESATNYYQQIKNRRPAVGLEIVSYLSQNNSVAKAG